ncbi:MAG: thiamine phosphate synthase [Phycisphaerales bacterium]
MSTSRHEVARLLDANANRAREALRVLEDAARFLLDDAELSEALKRARHDLRDALERLPDGWLEANRDTPGDVGVQISVEAERERTDANAVIIAAGKRLSEALRSLEEYGKTVDPEFGAAIEAIRYRGYALESALQARFGSGRRAQWTVCVLVSERLCTKRSWLETVEAAIAGGADCIQLREKDLPDGKLLGRATAVVNTCHDAGVAAIINDRPDLALLARADGVHLGQTDLPAGHVRRLAGRRLIVGVSTANLVQAEAARRSGADYCGVGPMFATTTKEKPVLAGPEYLREFIEKIPLPHLAIGGINESNIERLVEAGVEGVAVSSAVCGADDPEAVTRSIRESIERGRARRRPSTAAEPDAPGA